MDDGQFTVTNQNGNIYSAGSLDVNGAVNLAAQNVATTVEGTLQVNQTSTFNGDVTIKNSLHLYHSDGDANSITKIFSQKVNNKGQLTIEPHGDGTNGHVIIAGNLTVQGTTTSINSNEVNIGDSIMKLNSDYNENSPSENAGLEINRGSQPNSLLIWDESNDRWTIKYANNGAQDFYTDGSIICNQLLKNGGGVVSGTIQNATNSENTRTSWSNNNTDYPMTFVHEHTNNEMQQIKVDGGNNIRYNPYTNILTVPTLTASFINGFSAQGPINFTNQNMQNVNITSGGIAGTTINGTINNANITIPSSKTLNIQNGKIQVSAVPSSSTISNILYYDESSQEIKYGAAPVAESGGGSINHVTVGDKVSIGTYAGITNQGGTAIAIGHYSGNSNQSSRAVAIGHYSGKTNQGWAAVGVGEYAGSINSGYNAISIGAYAGYTEQGDYSIAIGRDAGKTSQKMVSVAIGKASGLSNLGPYSVAIGHGAGNTNTTSSLGKTVAIGNKAAEINQGNYAVAIGTEAGRSYQGNVSIAIGNYSGNSGQGNNSIAIGGNAGQINQPTNSVSIGHQAGVYGDPTNVGTGGACVAIGYQAGYRQAYNCISIGKYAGRKSDDNSYEQPPNSICLNANGTDMFDVDMHPSTAGFFVAPIRNDIPLTGASRVLHYDQNTHEIIHLPENAGMNSDDRLKHEEIDISNASNIIEKLQPKLYKKTHSMYHYIDISYSDICGNKLMKREIEKDSNGNILYIQDTGNLGSKGEDWVYEAGLIAQDVNEISELKEFVIEGDDLRPWSLKYSDINMYHLSCTKELIDNIKSLKSENSLLKEKLNEILSEMGKNQI